MTGDLQVPRAVQDKPNLSVDEARKLTDRIRDAVSKLLPLIKEAFDRRADVALGYPNWIAYCDAELRGIRLPVSERREAVVELRQAGMSTRAIAAATGVSKGTVDNDLSQLANSGQLPDKVVGLDGKTRPATRPAKPNKVTVTQVPCCEKCGAKLPADQADAGFVRCENCDSYGDHIAAELPGGGFGPCKTCHPPAEQAAEQGDPLAGVGEQYKTDPAERIAAVAETAPDYVRPATAPAPARSREQVPFLWQPALQLAGQDPARIADVLNRSNGWQHAADTRAALDTWFEQLFTHRKP